MAPVCPVRGPRDVGIVVCGVFAGGGFRAADKINVHGFEEDFGHFNRGTDDYREGAEAELHNGTVFLGQLVDGAMREGANEIKVTDNGPWFWTRWWVKFRAEIFGEEKES